LIFLTDSALVMRCTGGEAGAKPRAQFLEEIVSLNWARRRPCGEVWKVRREARSRS
jgi:hypothetical protein